MARANILCRSGMPLVLSLAAAFSGSSARADAESESPFPLDPPVGWAREVGRDGRVNYYDPASPDYCVIQIQPVIPEDLSAADDLWLLQFFDAQLRQEMSSYARQGILVPYDADPPIFEKGSIGTYIYKELNIDAGRDMINHQTFLAFKDGQLQQFFSVIDVGRCPNGSDTAKTFFSTVASHLE